MQGPGDQAAYVHYARKTADHDVFEDMLAKRFSIQSRLAEREAKRTNADSQLNTAKRVRFLLQPHEKQHIESYLLRHRLFRVHPISDTLAEIVDDLGGYGIEAYARIISKWIDNNAHKVFERAGWSSREIKQRMKCSKDSSPDESSSDISPRRDTIQDPETGETTLFPL